MRRIRILLKSTKRVGVFGVLPLLIAAACTGGLGGGTGY
jgi:hypothetical protein